MDSNHIASTTEMYTTQAPHLPTVVEDSVSFQKLSENGEEQEPYLCIQWKKKIVELDDSTVGDLLEFFIVYNSNVINSHMIRIIS
jgi:hypothetical protein